MKKTLCFIFICIIFLLSTSRAEHENHFHEEAAQTYIAAATDGLWYAEGNVLKRIQHGQLDGEIELTVSAPIQGVAGRGADAFILMSSDDKLTVHLYSRDSGNTTAQFTIKDGHVRTMIATKDGLAVLYEPTEEQLHDLHLDGELLYYSFAGELLQLTLSQAVSIYAEDENMMLIVRSDGHDFQYVRLDLRTMRPEVLLEQYLLAALPLPQGGYCYATHSHLLFLDESGYSTQLMEIAATAFFPPYLVSVRDCIYLLDVNGLSVFFTSDIANFHANKSSPQLTIVNCFGIEDFRLTEAIKQFEAESGTHVVLSEMNRQQLLTQLIAGENSIDILFVDSSNLTRFQKAGVLQSLNGYVNLRESLESWLNVLSVAIIDGDMYCVPAYISASNIYVDTSLLSFFDRMIPQKCTWSELFDLADHFQADTNGDGFPDAYYLIDNLYNPEFIRQYVSACSGGKDIFSEPSFISLMTQYKQLVKRGYIGDEYNDNDTKGGLFYINRILEINSDPFLPMPTLEDGSGYVVGYVHGMAVSIFSEKKELAADFLALYASPSNQIYPVGFGFVKDINLYPDAAALSEHERQQIEKSIEQYELVSPIWLNDDFTDALMSALKQYFTDEISIEELVNRLNQKMEMIQQG